MDDTDDATVRDAVGIGLAVGIYGVSFGVLAVAAGLSPVQAVATSLLVFTGASQFAFIGVLGTGGSALAALAPAILLGARNAVYGIAMAPRLHRRPLRRALEAQLVIDESTAMAQARSDPAASRRAFLATGLTVFGLWNLGTAIGAYAGTAIGDPTTLGLDAMFPAAFLALLAPQLRTPGAPRVAATGAVLAVVLVPFVPAGLPIVAAALALVPAAVRSVRASREATP